MRNKMFDSFTPGEDDILPSPFVSSTSPGSNNSLSQGRAGQLSASFWNLTENNCQTEKMLIF